MANIFWNFVSSLVPGTVARAEDVNTNLTGVQTGFDSVETEMDKAIQVTNSPGTTDISLNAVARANRLIAFDANGDIEAATLVGSWKGDHADAAGTDYAVRDIVRDAAASLGLNNLYMCNTAHTSTGDLATDTAYWDKIVDVTDVVTAKNAAETAQSAAEDAQSYSEEWANKAEDSLVSVAAGGNGADEYSSLHHAAKASASATTAATAEANLNGYGTVASSATPAFDLNGNQTQEILALTHDPAPTLSNLAAGRSITVLMTASAADRDITYDGDWIQHGYLPTTIPSGKSLMLSFVSTTALDTGVHVTGVLEP